MLHRKISIGRRICVLHSAALKTIARPSFAGSEMITERRLTMRWSFADRHRFI